MHESLCGAAEGGNENFSNMGMDCYYHRVHPRHNQIPSHTHCITWQFASPLFSLLTSSLSSPIMSLLGVTVCLGVTVETFVSILEGNLRCIFCLFLFCKAYDSYCIRASSNNKNCKKLLACFNFIPLYECDGWVVVAQVVQRLEDRFHSYSSLRVKCIKVSLGTPDCPQCIHRSVSSPTWDKALVCELKV